MVDHTDTDSAALDRDVRVHVFHHAAGTGRVPISSEVATALGRSRAEVEDSVQRLAADRVWFLAPGTMNIWAANPFCAVPSNFRVDALGRTFWGICIWDALGIPAALRADAVITTRCGDCEAEIMLEVRDGALVRGEGVVHFAVPAIRWWENIAFT